METGILIKSTSFNTTPYWVVKCDTPNLKGSINNELPINLLTFNFHPWKNLDGPKIKFEIIEIDNIPHANLRFAYILKYS